MADEQFPDIYGDGVSVAAGPFGLTFTFFLSDPFEEARDPKRPGRIVARLRVSPVLARSMIAIMQRSLDNMPEPRLSYEADEAEKPE